MQNNQSLVDLVSLEALAIKFNVDKHFAHSYIPTYEMLFNSLRVNGRPVKKLLEIGLGYEDLMKPFVPAYTPAASLRMWREYFGRDVRVAGCDIRGFEVAQAQSDHGLETYLCDQSNVESLLSVVSATGGLWNVVIDDGSHETAHQILTARTLLPYMAKGGVYVVEDVREPNKVAQEIGGRVYKFDKRPDDCLVVVRCA